LTIVAAPTSRQTSTTSVPAQAPMRTLGRCPTDCSMRAVRSSTLNVPCLPGLCRIATTTSSNSLLARVTTST
jgi:hypothetical protein